jgi:hypothetical protein
MFNDRIALNGFGKMFLHFFKEQIKYVDLIREYIIIRGGQV